MPPRNPLDSLNPKPLNTLNPKPLNTLNPKPSLKSRRPELQLQDPALQRVEERPGVPGCRLEGVALEPYFGNADHGVPFC